nr:microtubule-actin cross-linking factor 1-like isoform X2 [Onthophagus taurus]
MVRVGGGWVALDEFLLKNDPCRVMLVLPLPDPDKPEQHEPWCPLAKGRTNIELREQFILADGVSQTMSAFRPKTSASTSGSSASSLRTPAGPITKVRERSGRSVPMSRSSRTAGTPDSQSDTEGTGLKTPRKMSYRSTLTPGGSRPSSQPASRTGSRPGSKPPSRHGSNLSLDSTDDGTPSRIPRRTTVSRTGTSTPRRLGVNGTGSRPRTPTGLISPASPAQRSRIPVYKGSNDTMDPESPSQSTSSSCSVSFSSGFRSLPSSGKTKIPVVKSRPATHSRSTTNTTIPNAPNLRTASRTRTPSGSNTPVPPGMQTAASRLLRKPSDSKSKESKEPFRL